MFKSLFVWFENRYSPLVLAADRQPPMGLVRFVSYFLIQFRTVIGLRMVLVAMGSIGDAMIPIFVGLIVGMLATTPVGEMFSTHWPTFALMLAVVVGLRSMGFLLDILVRNHALTPNLINRVRWQSHWHVIRQGWNFFQNDFAGRISTKVMQAGDAVELSLNLGIDALWYALVFVVIATVVLAGLDPVLLIPVLLWLVAFGALLFVTLPLVAKHSKLSSEANSVMTGRIVDSYTNIQTLKTFAVAGKEDDYVADAVRSHTEAFRRLMRVFSVMWACLFILDAALVVGVTWIALDGWNRGVLSAAAVATAIPFALQIMSISGWILNVSSTIFREIGRARDSMETVARPLSMADDPGAPELKVTAGAIRYDRVGFNYWKGGEGQVISDFSLNIAPGEKVGLVGRSGAGKSTLVNLLLRLFDAESGQVLIDGQDVRKVTHESLRRAVGFVSQDTSLLHRSIRDNIKYGRPDATDEQMIAAAGQARIHEVIETLSDGEGRFGYDAHVGERGVKLSGGQRQRIAIARVLLKNAPILVLDEATSALDSEVEAAIQEQLTRLMADKTVIAIAHRLSTIAAMDRLVVLDQGRIVEEGSHAELLAHGGTYARLWQRQSGGFIDVEARDDETADDAEKDDAAE